MSKKVIIIGASSGMGYELAKLFSAKGWEVGTAARREDRLKALQQELSGRSYTKKIDISRVEEAREQLAALIDEMGGLDVLVINSGTGDLNPDWRREQEILMTNAGGFIALAKLGYDYFTEKKGGQLAGVSSIAALRGMRKATVYSATKAFITNYMEGLRHRSVKKGLGITVTDIRPGFVMTAMTEKNKGMFWVATAEKAAGQIYDAIIKKKDVAYISRRWVLISWVFKLMPRWIHYRM